MTEARSSVLAALTAEVMAEKKTSARKLTPVEGEVVTSSKPDLPHDTGLFMSNERLHEHAKQLREFASEAITIAEGLDEMLNSSSIKEEKVDIVAEQRAREKKADEEFRQHFEAQQKAAQEATFTKAPEPEPLGEHPDPEDEGYPTDDAPSAWHCPEHAKQGVEKVTAKNRQYVGCPVEGCNAFAR